MCKAPQRKIVSRQNVLAMKSGIRRVQLQHFYACGFFVDGQKIRKFILHLFRVHTDGSETTLPGKMSDSGLFL